MASFSCMYDFDIHNQCIDKLGHIKNKICQGNYWLLSMRR